MNIMHPKRKGDDFINNQVTATVVGSAVGSPYSSFEFNNRSVVTTTGGGASASIVTPAWDECRQALHQIRKTLVEDESLSSVKEVSDPILVSIRDHLDCLTTFQTATHHNVVEVANVTMEKLQIKIEEATKACQEESEELFQLQAVVSQLIAERQGLATALQDNDDELHRLQDDISQYKEEAQIQFDHLDIIDTERKMQVPRLRQQISLYAACTGVKWDFTEEGMLVGQVDIPSNEHIARFRIDPNESSKFDIANQLWSLMEGQA